MRGGVNKIFSRANCPPTFLDDAPPLHVRVDEVTCEYFVNTAAVSNHQSANCNCAVIYEIDVDFGKIEAIDVSSNLAENVVPSQRIKSSELTHLSDKQRIQLLNVLHKFPEVFSEIPGLCKVDVFHEIPIAPDFKPERLKAYRVPEKSKPEVDRQIAELLKLGFIEPSTSPMASPIVCILRGKHGQNGVRIAIDYRYVNRYTLPDVTTSANMSDLIQQIGQSTFISSFDAKSGYHQTLVKPEHRWLTAFICNAGLFQWTRTPFGMRSSGCTFVRALATILQPIRQFTHIAMWMTWLFTRVHSHNSYVT